MQKSEAVEKTVYLAGPMSGYPEYNYPAFHHAAENLRRHYGYHVVSPAELDAPEHTPGDWAWEQYLARDLRAMLEADASAVFVLPGWRQSRGAQLEVSVAQALGKDILDIETHEPVYEDAAQEAHRLTKGARQSDYGHPLDDFSRTGRMWAAILGIDEVTAEQVGLCMAAVKISRELNRPKRDNRVDLAGYANCVDMIVEERGRRTAGGEA